MAADGDTSPAPPAPPASGWRSALLAVRFASELALLAVLAWAGARAGVAPGWRMALAVLGPAAAAVCWGVLMAPRSPRRLRDPWRLVAETAVFAVAAGALAATGAALPAAVFAVAALGAAFLARLATPEP